LPGRIKADIFPGIASVFGVEPQLPEVRDVWSDENDGVMVVVFGVARRTAVSEHVQRYPIAADGYTFI
jgi:hypothetical protein